VQIRDIAHFKYQL